MTGVDESKRDYWLKAHEARDRKDARAEKNEPEPLKGGGGGGTSEGMVPLKDYVDAKDDAVESRLTAKLDGLATNDSIRKNVWGAAAAILAVLIGLAAFGGDRFDAGLSLADQRESQLRRDVTQDENLRRIDQKLDLIIAGQGSSKTTAPND